MLILGIDPGYAIIGYGIIEYNANRFSVVEYGAITTDANCKFTSRLDKIYSDLSDVILRYNPDVM